MRNGLLLGVVLIALVAGPATGVTPQTIEQEKHCSFPLELVDATGTTVTIEEEPTRVVTLSPSAAQTMWEIGAKEKVVGVTKYATYLDGAASKKIISGGGKTINVEEVVSLDPDLVIAPHVVSTDTVAKLRSVGVTVFYVREAETIEAIYQKTLLVGRLTGACEGARRTVEWMKSELAIVDRALEGEPRANAFYGFFGWTAGNGTFIDTILERAGANNVAAAAGIEGFSEFNPEILINRSIDWIIRNSDDPTVPTTAAFNSTTAVETGQIIVLNANYISQPAPRVVYAIVNITKAIYPESYAAATAAVDQNQPTPTETVTTETTSGGTDTASTPTAGTTSETSPTTGTGPGFSHGSVVIALACVLFLGLRWKN